MKMIWNLSVFFATITVIFYIGLMAYAWIMADRLIFPKIEPSYQDGPDIFKLQTNEGERISAYFLQDTDSPHLLLYCHGNGEDLGHIRPHLEMFRAGGVSVLAFDYPGYGTSAGISTEAGCYAAAEAAYFHAVHTLGHEPRQITLYGRSLGGGPATWLASRHPVGRMILDGTFTSTFRVLTRWRLLPWDRFDNLARLPDITCPILFIHGIDDATVPFHHAVKNHAAYQGEKETLWIQGAGHNDLYEIAGDRYWNRVFDYTLDRDTSLQ